MSESQHLQNRDTESCLANLISSLWRLGQKKPTTPARPEIPTSFATETAQTLAHDLHNLWTVQMQQNQKKG